MIQFDNLPEAEIKKRILEKMPENQEALVNDEYFDDIGKIGALLSSEIMCMNYCGRLNDSLIEYAKRQGVYDQMSAWGGFRALKKSPGPGPKKIKVENRGDNDLTLRVTKHKHYKVLSGFLTEFEEGHRFNEGGYNFESQNKLGQMVPLEATPQKAVTLPGFAPPDVFRQQLLARARHFKDPTVGTMHGEFTHRIQWYIVCEHQRLTNQLTKLPADIFKACARPVFVGGKTTVWDMVFEGAYDAKDFRKPEKITEFFLRASRPTHRYHKNVWFLAALTEGRFAKREIEKLQQA